MLQRASKVDPLHVHMLCGDRAVRERQAASCLGDVDVFIFRRDTDPIGMYARGWTRRRLALSILLLL